MGLRTEMELERKQGDRFYKGRLADFRVLGFSLKNWRAFDLGLRKDRCGPAYEDDSRWVSSLHCLWSNVSVN